MIRLLHRWPGLAATLLLLVLSLSGAALSVFPAAESLSGPGGANGLSVAELAARVQAEQPKVEQLRRSPDGIFTAYWFDGNTAAAAVINPATGWAVGNPDRSAVLGWLTEIHRSLFLGLGGRIGTAIAALAMLVLAISGLMLVARRTGGWRRFFAPLKGPLAGRIHAEVARIAVVGFSLSSVTALWLAAGSFGWLPEPTANPAFPSAVSGQTGFDAEKIDALRLTPASRLIDLTFPAAGDATDVYTLQTDAGTGYIDQGNGNLLAWRPLGGWDRVTDIAKMLHTGQGAPILGLVLGLITLSIPALALTGFLTWFRGIRGRPRIRGNVGAAQAGTIVLVGSEGGTTWSFAATLHRGLTAAREAVHVAPLSAFAPARYGKAKRIIILTATYGEGDAPAGAAGFVSKLAALRDLPAAPLAVLGFGDRSFPDYAAYAERLSVLARKRGWTSLLPFATVDRQNPQDFNRWGHDLGKILGIDLELNHQPVMPRTEVLTLTERRDYGTEVQAPTAILRFALPPASFWPRITLQGFSGFQAGGLLAIVPRGSETPRFYSLASSRRDGFVEICVSLHPGGLCSGQLLALSPGDTVTAFTRPNPGFRPARGKAPLILVGAGTGIGPLAGFIRANRNSRPMHLYFGARNPRSDALYDRELAGWRRDGRLASLAAAYSRTEDRAYVQDVLREDAARLTRYIAEGAHVLVCGGRDMARGVSEALAEILAPMGMTPAMLKADGRYAEDVY